MAGGDRVSQDRVIELRHSLLLLRQNARSVDVDAAEALRLKLGEVLIHRELGQ